MTGDIAELARQNEVMISLLGRIAFTDDRVREIVTRKKQNPKKYVDGYNACDGRHTVSEIAKIVGVNQSTLSPILQDWENAGIVFVVEKPGGKFYKKLFPIREVLK